jgi:vacuolar-type H+-ATPase subunit E/Vma4
MAIEDILRALDEQAQADCNALIEEAEIHAQLIVEDAERSANEIHENFARQVERVARAEAAKTINAARLDAKMEVSSAKGSGVESVFDAARQRLGELRSSGYDALFDALAAEAFAGLSGDVKIFVAPDDAERAQRAAAANGLTAEVAPTLQTAGGLVVEASGGRVIRRNTFEDRLDRVCQTIQADVARVLLS